jgi:hypothetical protein
MGEQEVEIFCRGEIELPIIAPGDHVYGAAWGNDPRSARHPNPQRWAHEILNQWRRLHGIPTCRIDRQELKSPTQEFKHLARKRCPVPFFARTRRRHSQGGFSLDNEKTAGSPLRTGG